MSRSRNHKTHTAFSILGPGLTDSPMSAGSYMLRMQRSSATLSNLPSRMSSSVNSFATNIQVCHRSKAHSMTSPIGGLQP